MPLLACRAYVVPVLEALARAAEGLEGSALAEEVALATSLSEPDRSLSISDGTPRYMVRIKQARYWLKNAGLVAADENGRWRITDGGRDFIASGGDPTTVGGRARPEARKDALPTDTQPDVEAPDERIDEAIAQVRRALAADLLARLGQASSTFFEVVVLAVLKGMGYSGVHGEVKRTGKPGDEGIDGVVSQDRLGLDRICVQAKRSKKPVQPDVVREFCGALDQSRATKGVILTTSSFSPAARKAAATMTSTIRLVDGQELADLMIDFGVGVSRTKQLVVPVLDRTFFEDY